MAKKKASYKQKRRTGNPSGRRGTSQQQKESTSPGKSSDSEAEDANGLEDVVSQCNSDLNTAKNRTQGLLVLHRMVEECTAQVFGANFHTWLNLLLQILQGHAQPHQQKVALQTLTVMIRKVTAFPELSRDMGTAKVRTILPVLLSLMSDQIKEEVVACISCCVIHFPGPTSYFKDKIETFLLLELDSLSPSQAYIRCYALLARCGSGSQKDKHREAWTCLYEKITQAMKSVLYLLYDGLESGEDQGEDSIFQRKLPDVQPGRTCSLVQRLCTLCACLVALLRESFPSTVPLHVDEILQLICRILAVQPDMLVKKGSTDHLLLLSYLPAIYCSAMSLLARLIVCGRRLLVSCGGMVMGLCVQCLTSMSAPPAKMKSHSSSQAFRKARQCVYQTLETWMQVLGASCLPHNNSSPGSTVKDGPLGTLLTLIFSDIAIVQPEALQLGKSGQKTDAEPPPKKKRKKQRVHQEMSSSSSQAFLPDTTQLVCAALRVLQQIFANVGLYMNETTLRAVKSQVCELVRESQQCVRGAVPYSTSALCLKELYSTLTSAVTVHTPDPVLLSQAVSLFQRGAVHRHFMVALACREAIAACQSLIHPQVPCLLQPVSRTAVDNTNTTTTNTTNSIFNSEASTSTSNATLTFNTVATPSTADISSPFTKLKAAPRSAVLESSSTSTATTTTTPTSSSSVSLRDSKNEASSSSSGIRASTVDVDDGGDQSNDVKVRHQSTEKVVPKTDDSSSVGAGGSSSSEDEDGDKDPDTTSASSKYSAGEEEKEKKKDAAIVAEGCGGGGDDGGDDDNMVDRRLSSAVEKDVEMSEDVSAMMSSFVPCEADSEDDMDSDSM